MNTNDVAVALTAFANALVLVLHRRDRLDSDDVRLLANELGVAADSVIAKRPDTGRILHVIADHIGEIAK